MQDPPRSKVLPHLRKKPRFPSDDAPVRPPGGGRQRLRMALAAAAMLFTLIVIYPVIERTMDREAAADAAVVTDCDRLAAHPADTQKLAPGVPEERINVQAARKACHTALIRHPDDGRTLYELSRTYDAGGDPTLGLNYLQKSVDAGYAHAQFILGSALVYRGEDVCEGGRLLVGAARQRHFPSKLALATNWMSGGLKTCGLDVSESEITQMLSAAAEFAETDLEKTELAAVLGKWSTR